MTKPNALMLSLLLFVLGTSETFATNFHVNTESELDDALHDVQGGDTIFLANKTWNNLKLTSNNSGISNSQPIRIRPKYLGMATLTGKCKIRISGNYTILEGFLFQNCATLENSTVVLNHAKHSSVHNNKFRECGSENPDGVPIVKVRGDSDYASVVRNEFRGSKIISVTSSDNQAWSVRIAYNHFKNIPAKQNGDGAEAIALQGGTNFKVEYNYFDNCDGDEETISVKTSGHHIRYNYFRNNSEHGGVTLRTGNASYVYGNFFYQCKEGIRIFGENHYVFNNHIRECRYGIRIQGAFSTHAKANNCVVLNNTIINSSNVGFQVGDATATSLPGNNKFYNNIVQQKKGVVIYQGKSGAMAKIRFKKNLIHATGTAIPGSSASGIEAHNPSLSIQGSIYRISSSSYARGRAQNYGLVSTDMDGQARNDLDIGADEYSTDPITKSPVGNANTGPGW